MQEDIKKACEVLRAGGVILYPTDTVWGIGCDATNEEAVKKVYEIKQRSDSKSMIVLVDNPFKLQQYVEDIPEIAWDLITLTEKPLTIIYENARRLARNLVAEDGSAGIRITNEPFSYQLCKEFRKPVVATSANISGEPFPEKFMQIDERIKNVVDYVVTYRQKDGLTNIPSAIIKLNKDGTIQIIRK